MFGKKSKSKLNLNVGSKESLEGSGGYQSSSSENLSGSRDHLVSPTSLNRSIQYDVHYMGVLPEVNMGGMRIRDPQVHLIDKVEEAQLEGKIHLVSREEDAVYMNISKFGLKVTDREMKEVLQRHPLHSVAEIIYYNDSFLKTNLAIKIGSVGRQVYDCYIFQCTNEDQANNICHNLKSVFDIIMGPVN